MRFPAVGIALWVETDPAVGPEDGFGLLRIPSLFAVTANTFPNPRLGWVSDFLLIALLCRV